jgi:hypothetical protein
MFLAGGNKKEGMGEDKGARSIPAVSLLDAEPVLTRRREGGPRRAEVSKGEVEGRGTKSIFKLRYQIASYTGYVGNLAPSPKHETNTTTDGSAQGEPEYMCNDETRAGTYDSGRREPTGERRGRVTNEMKTKGE